MKRSKRHSTTALDSPSAVAKRKRNVSAGPSRLRSNSRVSESACYSISTPPVTPKSFKKRVRPSEPRLEGVPKSASSGLTPSIRRVLQITPPSSCHCPAPLSGCIQIAPLRETLSGRAKRRLRRNGLSEKMNEIEREGKQKMKSLQAEVEKLKTELEAKRIEIQSIKDRGNRGNQDNPGDSITTDAELRSRVQELEQQIKHLKAKVQQKEAESESFEDADSVITSRDLPSLNVDDCQAVTTDDALGSEINDNMIVTPVRLSTSLPSPPSTMPNTPFKGLNPTNALDRERRYATRYTWALAREF